MSQEVKLTCMACTTEFWSKDPRQSVVNTPEFSLLFFPHPDPDICPNCGAAYAPAMKGFQVDWVWTKIDRPPEKLVVIPGSRAKN